MNKISLIVTALGLLALIGIFVGLAVQYRSEDDIVNAVNNGVVIDKEFKDVTPLFGVLFGSPKVKYKLIVKVSGENEKTVYKTVSVPEQVYFQVNIGDYIDDLESLELKQE